MGIFNIFKKREETVTAKEPEKEIKPEPEEEYKWECKGCGRGIDPEFHGYTKRGGFYFHRVCWKKAMKMGKDKNLV